MSAPSPRDYMSAIAAEFTRLGLRFDDGPYHDGFAVAGTGAEAERVLAEWLQHLQSLRPGATFQEADPSLPAHWIPGEPGQRLAYVMMQAELEGLVCSVPMRGKQHTYALLEDRVPAGTPLARDAALALLATRFFRSHGPAMVRDFAWWSGLTISDATAAVEMVRSDLECANVDGKTYWTRGTAGAVATNEPVIHLLPNYDEHVVANRNHSPSLDTAAVDALRTRTDRPLDAHLVARNGLIIGGWKRTLGQKAAVAQVIWLVKLKPRERATLKFAVQEYGVFLGLPVSFELT